MDKENIKNITRIIIGTLILLIIAYLTIAFAQFDINWITSLNTWEASERFLLLLILMACELPVIAISIDI